MSKRQRQRRTDRRRQAQRRGKTAIGASLALGAALAAPATGQAATTFTVTNTNESGTGSLAAAINGANADAAADTIIFQPGLHGRIALNSAALPDLTHDATIVGPGAGQLVIDGNDDGTRLSGPLLRVTGPSAVAPIDVSISGLTFEDGGDSGSTGGGILATNADLTVADSTLTGNKADVGAALNVTAGSLDLARSTVSGNHADAGGGGIGLYESRISMSDSTVTGNSAACGGGLVLSVTSGAIARSTISGNTATSEDPAGYTGGGGIWEYGKTATDHLDVTNTTIAGNHAASTGGGFHSYNAGGSGNVTVASSTVVGNSAEIAGGGMYAGGPGSQPAPVISNSIVAGNRTVSAGTDLAQNGTTPFRVDFSLVQAAPPAVIDETVPGSNITGRSPQLTALDDNGGPTQTMAPTLSSPVIDAGRSSVATDQRGLTRPIDRATANSAAAGANGADMGAVEEQSGPFAGPEIAGPPPPPPTPPAPVAVAKVSRLKLRGHALSFKVTCGGAVCSGSGTLTTTELLRARTIRLARAHLIKRRHTVGRKAYRVAPGKSRTVTVRLNRTGVKLLKRFHRLPVRLSVTLKRANGKPKTVKHARKVFRLRRH